MVLQKPKPWKKKNLEYFLETDLLEKYLLGKNFTLQEACRQKDTLLLYPEVEITYIECTGKKTLKYLPSLHFAIKTSAV